MKYFLSLFLLLSAIQAQAVDGPRAPKSCRAVVQSKLGDAMRERAWELSRARTLVERAIQKFRTRCSNMANDLRQSRQITEVDELKSSLSKENVKMQELSDDYARAAREAMEGAHSLREETCETRIREEKAKVEDYAAAKQKEVYTYLAYYCR